MEHLSEQTTALVNMVIAGLLAAIPGLDRELRQRPAGLRTHMIVGSSAAFMTSAARIIYSPDSAARIITGLITGIGFLGAGVIFRRKFEVYELTTAASIWMVALMGIVVGFELYILGAGSVILLGMILTILRLFKEVILHTHSIEDEEPD